MDGTIEHLRLLFVLKENLDQLVLEANIEFTKK